MVGWARKIIHVEIQRIFREYTPLVEPLSLDEAFAPRDEVGQLAFFGQNREKEEKLAEALDRVRDKFGEQAVTRARLLK